MLADYLGHFLKYNAPRIARFFLDMYLISNEYINRTRPDITNYQVPP